MWALISWVAVSVGFYGTWVAATRRRGWLIGAGCSLLWLAYDVERGIWAGALAAVVAVALNVRNYRVGRCRNTL